MKLISHVSAVIFHVLLFFFIASLPSSMAAGELSQSPETLHQTSAPIATMNQPPALSQDLQTHSSPGELLMEDVPGPAAFLGVLLKKLTIVSAASDVRFTELLSALPKMFPELYSVLTEL